MRPSRTAILLILAFLATFFAPARASWSCPDGTPCAADSGRGFVCAGDRCAVRSACCEVTRPLRCRHGAFPGVEGRRDASPSLSGPDHCRFGIAARPFLVAVSEQGRNGIPLPFALLPEAPAVEPAVPARIRLRAHRVGCRPPPPLFSGPSRAPPPVPLSHGADDPPSSPA